jgi:hypothetical protein
MTSVELAKTPVHPCSAVAKVDMICHVMFSVQLHAFHPGTCQRAVQSLPGCASLDGEDCLDVFHPHFTTLPIFSLFLTTC